MLLAKFLDILCLDTILIKGMIVRNTGKGFPGEFDDSIHRFNGKAAHSGGNGKG